MIRQVVRRMKKLYRVTSWGIEVLRPNLGGDSIDRSETRSRRSLSLPSKCACIKTRSLETRVAISTPDPRGVLARSTIRLPFDGGCNDRPARTKIYIDALSDVATNAEAQAVKLFLYARKAIQPQYDANAFFAPPPFDMYYLTEL